MDQMLAIVVSHNPPVTAVQARAFRKWMVLSTPTMVRARVTASPAYTPITLRVTYQAITRSRSITDSPITIFLLCSAHPCQTTYTSLLAKASTFQTQVAAVLLPPMVEPILNGQRSVLRRMACYRAVGRVRR